MRRLISVLGLALVGATAFVTAGFAQNAPAAAAPGAMLTAPSIALVDMQRVISESAAGKSMLAQLDVERRKIRDQLTKLQEDLKHNDDEVRRQRPILSQDALNEKVQDLQRKAADAQRFEQERSEAFSKAQNDSANVIVDNMRDIVQQISNERRIGLVLRKEVVIALTDKNMDITDDVIQRLNTKLPAVTVTVAAAGSAPAAPAGGPAAAKPMVAPALMPAPAPAKK